MNADGHGRREKADFSAPSGALVVPLRALDRGAVEVCGGKAANLGEMIAAGFPVPDGFCVTTDAYRRATQGPALEGILEEIAKTPATDADRLDKLAASARQHITEVPIPEAVADACAEAYRALGDGALVAVRSSATAEDLPDASFAGQQDTYLQITGEAAVIDAVRRCWASLWTDRAVAYRAKNGIDPRVVRLAVVVQRMVPASVAGVLFTADPVSGKRRRAVIDASPGLGEAVVSGAVNPDHFAVDTETMTIETRLLGDKRVVIKALPGGGTKHVHHTSADESACLSDTEILALARLGVRVEAYYGVPQDTEWAMDEDRTLWLVQARPITTLFPIPTRAPASNKEAHVYLNFNVAQGVLQPFTRMGIQVWKLLVSGLFARVGFPWDEPEKGPSYLSEAAGRIFIDMTPFVRSDLGRRAMTFAFPRMEARSAALLEPLFADPRFGVEPTSKLKLLRTFGRIFGRTKIPLTALRFLAAPENAPEVCRAAGDRALAFGDVAPDATPEERLEAARKLLLEGPGVVIPFLVPAFVTGMLSWVASKKLLEGLATPAELETAFRALRNNPTTEMDLGLWGLSVRARRDPESVAELRGTDPAELAAQYKEGALPLVLQDEMEAFLEEYGARGVAEIDIGVPRWRDDPTHVLGALANYVTHPDTAVPPDIQFQRVEREAEAMVAELGRRAEAQDPIRGDLARFTLSRMRDLAGLREAPKFYVVRILGRARELLVDVGRALVERGRLAASDDVFMLDLAEVREALSGRDMRAVTAERRVELIRERGRRRLPRVYLSDGTEPTPKRSENEDPEGHLSGTPASTGQITARARVILEPNGAKLERGEILVAPSTDPGWTPLFLTAGGLVMEMGGAMSHGAVVAREYGIPAVVGVPDATTRIRTGDLVMVDGAAGTVKIVPPGN